MTHNILLCRTSMYGGFIFLHAREQTPQRAQRQAATTISLSCFFRATQHTHLATRYRLIHREMKIAGAIAAFVTLGCAQGFVAPVPGATAMRPQTQRAAERINESVELEKPKVCQLSDRAAQGCCCCCCCALCLPLTDNGVRHLIVAVVSSMSNTAAVVACELCQSQQVSGMIPALASKQQ